jgi:iron complex outermembrane receptor protein
MPTRSGAPEGARALLLATTVLGAAAMLGAPAGAAAQTPPGAPAKPASANAAPPAAPTAAPPIEEVKVTARRRTEKLQRVPVALTVISGAELKRQNLNTVQDILSEVPSADFRTSSSNKDRTIFVRGLGTISTSPGVEPSVSTVVDGVVLARAGQATVDLVGLDQIEVLRGPQGTLFGKNASAGVVNITTRNPTQDFHAFLDAGYFSGGDEYRVEGGVSGTIAPNVTGVFGVLAGGYGGNVHNQVNGQDVNGYTHDGFRSKVAWQPSDDLNVMLEADYLKSVDTIPNGVFEATSREAYPTDIVTPNPGLATVLRDAGITAGTDNRTIANNITSGADDDNGGLSLTVDKKLGDYDLTSITAWRIWHNTQRQDYDQISQITKTLPQVADRGDLLFDQVTEETRIASPKGGLIDYVAGFYYALAVDNEQYDRHVYSLGSGGALVNNRGLAQYGTDGNNLALFGEANVNFTPDFRAILGLRLVHDDLSYTFGRVATAATTGVRGDFNSQGHDNQFDYSDRIGLQYDITPQANAYFTYSRGYKGPAYNVFFNMNRTVNAAGLVTADDTRVLSPETSNAFEIGLKARALQGHVQANLAAFIEDFSNYQANFLDNAGGALVTRLINAGSVSSRGVEGDLTARPIDHLDLTGLFAYTDAHIDTFNCPAGAAASCNVNGEPLPFAPLWKLDARARYDIKLTDAYDLAVATDFDWQTKTQYQLTETPDTVQKAYGIWNASLTLADFDQGWRVAGLVKNILDTHYSSYLAYGSLAGVVRYVPRDDHRYFGIELHKDF